MSDNNELVNRVWMILSGSVDPSAQKLPEEAQRLLESVTKPMQAILYAFNNNVTAVTKNSADALVGTVAGAQAKLTALKNLVDANVRAVQTNLAKESAIRSKVEGKLGADGSAQYSRALATQSSSRSIGEIRGSLLSNASSQRSKLAASPNANISGLKEIAAKLAKELDAAVANSIQVSDFGKKLGARLNGEFRKLQTSVESKQLEDALGVASRNYETQIAKTSAIFKSAGLKMIGEFQSIDKAVDNAKITAATRKGGSVKDANGNSVALPNGANQSDVTKLEQISARFLNDTLAASVALEKIKKLLGDDDPIVKAMEADMEKTAQHIKDELDLRIAEVAENTKDAKLIRDTIAEQKEANATKIANAAADKKETADAAKKEKEDAATAKANQAYYDKGEKEAAAQKKKDEKELDDAEKMGNDMRLRYSKSVEKEDNRVAANREALEAFKQKTIKANNAAELKQFSDLEKAQTAYQNGLNQLSHKPTNANGDQVLTTKELANLDNTATALKKKLADVNAEIEDKGPTTALVKLQEGYKKLIGDIGNTYTEQKKLSDEIHNNTGKTFFDGLVKGVQGGSFRSMGGAAMQEFKKGFDGAGGGKDGLFAGLGGAGGFVGGFAAFTAVTAVLSGTFKLAKVAVTDFFNVLQNGFSTLQGFIQNAAQANLEVMRFAQMTGSSEADASKLVGLFNMFGQDANQLAGSISRLNKEIGMNNKFFTDNGIATRTAEGNARSVMAVMEDLNKKYHTLNDTGKQNFILDLDIAMGRFGASLTPLLSMNWDKMLVPLQKMNVIIQDAGKQNRLDEVTASMQALKAAQLGLSNTITMALGPAIKAISGVIVNFLTAHMQQIYDFFNKLSNEVISFVKTLGLLGDSNVIDDVANGMKVASAVTGDNTAITADNTQAIKDNASAIGDQITALQAQERAQGKVIKSITDARDALLLTIQTTKDNLKDAFNDATDPLNDTIKALEKTKKAWQDEEKTAIDAIDAEIKAIQDKNKALAASQKAAGKPLKAQLEELQDQQKAGAKDKTDLGAPLTAANHLLDDQAKAIQGAQKAADRAAADSAKGYAAQKKAITLLITAINAQAKADDKLAQAAKDALNVQIKAIQDVSTAAQDAADLQAYLDQRAYLMGQTLLAQAEARSAALSERSARQRTSGETDIDYQLRMQELAAAADEKSIKNAQDLHDLDAGQAIKLQNKARQDQIKIIQDQMAAIDLQRAQAKEANDAIIAGYDQQIATLDDMASAANDSAQASKDASQAQLDAIAAQKQANTDQIDAIKAAADAKKQALSDQIEAAQNAIDANNKLYGDQIDANTELINGLNDVKDATTAAFNLKIDPITAQIDGLKNTVQDLTDTYDEQVKQLDKNERAVHKLYDPQIKALQDIKGALTDHIADLQDEKTALDAAATAADALAASIDNIPPSPPAVGPDGGASDPNSKGGKLGAWVKKTFLDPFTEDISASSSDTQHGPQDGVGAGKTRSIGDALKESLDRAWETIKPVVVDLAGKIMSTLMDALRAWAMDHKEMFALLGLLIIDLIFFTGPTIAVLLAVAFFELFGKAIGDWVANHKEGLAKVGMVILGFIFPLAAAFDLLELLMHIFDKAFGTDLSDQVNKAGKKLFGEILKAGELLFVDLPKWLYDNIIKPIIDWVAEWGKLEKYFTDFWTELLDAGVKVFSTIGKWLFDNIIQPILDFTVTALETGGKLYVAYLKFWLSIFDIGVGVFKDVGGWLVDHIGSPLEDFFSGMPGRIKSLMKFGVNDIINMINHFIHGINDVANFGGLADKIGLNIHIGDIPQLLAAGGRVASATTATMGEGGFPEYAITTDPKYRARSLNLVSQLIAEMGGNANVAGLSGASLASVPSSNVRALPSGSAGNTFTLQIGEINANTKADGQAIAEAVTQNFEKWLDQLPAYSKGASIREAR